MARVRCAIYTRKSSEDGLEQDFNSLDAQREACAAFIASQKAEGWVLLPEHYDDGGLSGGTLERPALMRLMRDLEAGKLDQIVVYKIDRLTRSLADFAKLVERLDAVGAAFVSVTQSFNTATSMGRLTLNVLLSFAQFEREVTAERIRDKIAASKRRGLWMGGLVPFGYDADGRTLKIREDEAAVVRQLFELYRRLGTVRAVHAEALRLGLRSRVRVPGERQDGRRRELLARAHPSDAEQSALCRPHPAQAPRARRPARGDHRSRSLGSGAGWPCRQRRAGAWHGQRRRAVAVRRQALRRDRRSFDPDPCQHPRRPASLLRLPSPGASREATSDATGWRLPARALEQAILQVLVARFRDPVFPASIGADLPPARSSACGMRSRAWRTSLPAGKRAPSIAPRCWCSGR